VDYDVVDKLRTFSGITFFTVVIHQVAALCLINRTVFWNIQAVTF